MTLQVHDELVFDVPEDEIEPVSAMVQHEMEHVIELNVPLVADVGTGANWRDLRVGQAPSSARMAAAMRSAWRCMASSDSASIMTRARASVPE